MLAALERAGRIAWAVPRLESTWLVFTELLDVLHLRDDELPRGNRRCPSAPRSPASVATRLQAFASATKAYQDRLRQRVAVPPAPAAAVQDPLPEAIVVGYLEHYSDSLCGHPVVLDSAGRVVHVAARTENLAEHFFATAKQKLRRRLGRDMQDRPAQAALAANLLCPEHVRIVWGTLDRLPQAFPVRAAWKEDALRTRKQSLPQVLTEDEQEVIATMVRTRRLLPPSERGGRPRQTSAAG